MGARYIVPNVTVAKYFQIGPEPIEINSIIIPPPTASAGPDEPNERAAGNIGAGSDHSTGSGSKHPQQLVNIKLLSNEIREGMNDLPLKRSDLEISSTNILPMSDHLLMHIHGGGFIATSSATHEVCENVFLKREKFISLLRLGLFKTLGFGFGNSNSVS
jgi:hypothetical protein